MVREKKRHCRPGRPITTARLSTRRDWQFNVGRVVAVGSAAIGAFHHDGYGTNLDDVAGFVGLEMIGTMALSLPLLSRNGNKGVDIGG